MNGARPLSRLAWLAVIVTLGSHSPARADLRPAVLSNEEVFQQLTENHARIRRFLIEYEATGPDVNYYIHKTIAAQAPDDCFYHGSKGRAEFDRTSARVDPQWQSDPFQDWILITAARNNWGSPWSRVFGDFAIKPDTPLPPKVQQQSLFVALGWWPFEKRPWPTLDDAQPCVIPHLVQARKHGVLPAQEFRSGRWCHVLDNPGRDRIWVDTERRCAIVAREIFDPQTTARIMQIDASQFAAVIPGLWVPRAVHYREFDSHAPTPAGRRRHLLDSNIQLLKVQLNDQVDPALFRPQPLPAGAVVLHEDRSYEQIVPGGLELMDVAAKWLAAQPAPPPDPPGPGLRRLGLASPAALRDGLIIAVASLILIALRQRRSGGVRPAALGKPTRGQPATAPRVVPDGPPGADRLGHSQP